MKDLIMEALNKVNDRVSQMIPPKTKIVEVEDVSGLTVSELVEFSKNENIPSDAVLSSDESGALLCYDKEIPTTELRNKKYIGSI